jgi:hypothetical protein
MVSIPRRRFQFGIRTLLGAVALVVIPVAWVGRLVDHQSRAVRAIQSRDGKVGYNKYGVVVGVLLKAGSTDADLQELKPHLKNLPFLNMLVLMQAQMTDAGLIHLKEELAHVRNILIDRPLRSSPNPPPILPGRHTHRVEK